MSKKKQTLDELIKEAFVPVEEQPYEIPEKWVWVYLKDVLETLESGKRPKGGVNDIVDGIPSLGGEHLQYDGGFNFKNIKYVPIDFAKSMNKGIIKNKDILIVKDGATTGKTSFVDDDFPFPFAVVNEHIFICRPANQIHSKYLFYYIVSKEGQKSIDENIQGSAQGGINLKFASKFPVPLCGYSEQVRIANKIDNLFRKIDEAKNLIEEVKETYNLRKAAILSKAIRGELTANWRKTNKVDSAHHLYQKIKEEQTFKTKVKSEISESEVIHPIPPTWKWVRIGDVLKITSGGTPKKSNKEYYGGTVPWIKTGEIKWNRISDAEEYITELGVENSSAKWLPKNTVLVAMYGQGLTRGRAAILDIEATCNQAVCALLPCEYILPEYLFYYFMEGYNRFRSVAKGGNQENLSATVISSFPLPLPPLEEQKAIVEILNEIFEKENKILEVLNVDIEEIKNSILSKAFKGELGTNDPKDEPAIELLKTIIKEKV